MTTLTISGVGLCAPGMVDWAHAFSVLRGDAPYRAEPLGRLSADRLPPVERRRANDSSRLAMVAALQAVAQLPPESAERIATVFSSADGDTDVLAQLLVKLAPTEVMLSPTLFHNSVFNAPAGYWGLACQSRAASTTVSAAEASFAVGLCEAAAQALSGGARAGAVLYVAYDLAFPAILGNLGQSTAAFGCALLIDGSGDGSSGSALARFGTIALLPRDAVATPALNSLVDSTLIDAFAGNAAAAALPLLAAIARQVAAVIDLPYVDGRSLRVRYVPPGSAP